MDVLVPKDFDIASIEKCMMDYDCNFVSYEDEDAIHSRLGSNFIVLQEKYFIAHAAGLQVKCDYDCRNRIMRKLYPSQGDEESLMNNNFSLEKIDGVIQNCEPPYLLFTNECIRGYDTEDNTIIANYTNVDILKFAETTKSKECNNMFYVVYVGDDQYIYCDVRTLITYEYSSAIKHRIISILCGKPYDPFSQLQELKPSKLLPRVSNFHLRDIEGRPVETNAGYHLELYDEDRAVLDFYEDQLCATHSLNAMTVDKVVVQYSIVDGIHYLTWKNQFMRVAHADAFNGIQFTDQMPGKHQRLQFQVTENNTFIMVQWNQLNCLVLEVVTCNYTMIYFLSKHSSRRTNVHHVQFFLKKVET